MKVHIFRMELDNESEADVMNALLEEDKIPHTIVSHFSSAYDGLFQMSEGWGHVEIPVEYREKAEELMRNYKESLEK